MTWRGPTAGAGMVSARPFPSTSLPPTQLAPIARSGEITPGGLTDPGSQAGTGHGIAGKSTPLVIPPLRRSSNRAKLRSMSRDTVNCFAIVVQESGISRRGSRIFRPPIKYAADISDCSVNPIGHWSVCCGWAGLHIWAVRCPVDGQHARDKEAFVMYRRSGGDAEVRRCRGQAVMKDLGVQRET